MLLITRYVWSNLVIYISIGLATPHLTERTESTQESLGGSLLTYMGSEASQADLREVAYSLF